MLDPGALLDTTYLTIHDPRTIPASFLGVEALTVVCGALTLVHALRARSRGDGGALFAWVSIFVYGVCLEIASYNAFPTFTHGQFTVMFYHRKLPLYISAFYPMIIYTGQRTARRLGLARWAEPVVAGLVIVALDFPFDTVGPDAGWWAWDMNDPDVHVRWFGVPVTSYYWHLTWGAILTAICRWLEPRMRVLGAPGAPARFARLLLAFPVAGATMGLGRAAFLPFDLLVPLGVNDGTIVLVALAASLACLAFAPRDLAADRPRDRAMAGILAAWLAFHVVVALAMRGRVAEWGGKMAVVLAATAFGVGLALAVHRPQREPTASRA